MSEITVRMDKGFWKGAIVWRLQALDIQFLLKAPNQPCVRDALGYWRRSKRAEGVVTNATGAHSNSGRLWDGRLLSLEDRRPLSEAEGTLALDTHQFNDTAHHVLTNIARIKALAELRRYNADWVVKQRIDKLAHLAVNQTTVDNLDNKRLLWARGGLAYQLFHVLRTRLAGAWRRAQPKQLRVWLFRAPGCWATRGEQ